MEYIGCTIEFLRDHIEKQFTQDMSWSNYGKKGWTIDHIRPISSFQNLNDIEEQKKCSHWSNLQPLWNTTKIAREHGDMVREGNVEKGNKYEPSRP